MAEITVTVSKGTLLSESYKDSNIVSDNLTLTGNSMILSDGKVVSFEGRITQNSSKEEIGSFSYKNGNDSVIDPLGNGYYSSITIYREVSPTVQMEATNALLSGISKLQTSI